MARASDYKFVDFSAEAPADLNHYLCNRGSFSKLYTTGKDYAWCLEYARDRHAAATDLSVNHVTKTPYSKVISSSNWNNLLTDWIDRALDSRRFVHSLGDWEHGDIIDQSGVIANLEEWTRAAFYALGRPEFTAGEKLDDTKIAAFENLLLKLIYFWRPYDIYICESDADYSVEWIFKDKVSFSARGQQGLVFEHTVNLNPFTSGGWDKNYTIGCGGEYKAYINSWSRRLTDYTRYDNAAVGMADGFKRLWVFKVTKSAHPDWYNSPASVVEQERYVIIDREQVSGGMSTQDFVAEILSAANITDDIKHPISTEEEENLWRDRYATQAGISGYDSVRIELVEALDLGRISTRVEELA
jgi:hypothetical protein